MNVEANNTQNTTSQPWSTIHPITGEDAAFVAQIRAMSEPMKGQLQGTAARKPFDEVMEHVTAPEGVTYEEDRIGGILGWWCRPADIRTEGVILYIHGGGYSWGSALAYRKLAGQIATRTGALVFVPDYRLAPEHPFPAAIDDIEVCYDALVSLGAQSIALAGDSAGGGLSLSLLSILAARPEADRVLPVGAVVLSPLTDLTLTGESWQTRAAADPYFTHPQVEGLVQAYMGARDPRDPKASPLYADLTGLPPIRIYVGDDEVLLDDSRRYAQRAVAAGVDTKLDIYLGMPHVFPSSTGQLKAADQALDAIGSFLSKRLTS